MLATLPAKLYPEASLANNLILQAIEHSAAHIGVSILPGRQRHRTVTCNFGHSHREPAPQGRGISFRLLPLITPDMRTPRGRLRQKNGRTLTAPYQRLSPYHPRNASQRRVNAVCWHGHRDFFRTLFSILPDLTVRTAMAIYKGSSGFESAYRATYHRNAGSRMCPQAYGTLCECGD